MEKALVFIDSGFISKVSMFFGGGIPLKYRFIKFAKNLTGKENFIFKHLFFYTAPPFQSIKPNNDEKGRKKRYDSFIKSLSLEEDITIREGRCQKINNGGKVIYKQKGVDTFLTMDLMNVPIKFQKIKKVILIASDSDFVPVINELKSLGIEVILYTYFDKKRNSEFSTSNELLKSVTRYKLLSKKDFDDSHK